MARAKRNRRAGDAAVLKNEDLLAQIKSPPPYRRIPRRGKALPSAAARHAVGIPTFATDRLDEVMHLAGVNQVILIELGLIDAPVALVFACGGCDIRDDEDLYELLRRFLDGQVEPVRFDAMGEPE
jgi:hypothetical protein